MSLSVCLISAAPAARIAAVLEPVRHVADEVVIAADARVDAETLAGYAGLADRLFRIEYTHYERHLAWLHAQCSGDWILRLDHDELVSRALAERLPALLADRAVQQYWFRRAWLFPDAESVLEDLPWCVDFNNRLVRNDGTLRFQGRQHDGADAVDPREYVEEPLYHLELLVSPYEERRDKAIRYEVFNPLLVAPGGGRMNEAFYLPELRDSLATAPVPPEDRAALRAVLDAKGAVDPRPAPDARLVRQEEMDWHYEGRDLPESAYRAVIEPVGGAPALAPGQGRVVLFRVTNRGTEQWPAGLQRQPPIRASYHWLERGGSVHTADGVRTALPRAVVPGQRVLLPLEVIAPPEPGEYILRVDLVHEDVRWFEQPCDVPVVVAPFDALPPRALRLEVTPPRRRALRRPRLLIPRVIHRVWVGGAEMPAAHVAYGEGFASHHPEWAMRLWTDDDLPSLEIGEAEIAATRAPSELSNLARYEVLHRHGGLYLDTDVECLRPFDDLLAGVETFAGLELPGRVASSVLGSVPGHRVWARAARLARQTLGRGLHSADANGPYFLSLLFEQEGGVTIFGAEKFSPYLWDEEPRPAAELPEAYAIHHWARSWWHTVRAR